MNFNSSYETLGQEESEQYQPMAFTQPESCLPFSTDYGLHQPSYYPHTLYSNDVEPYWYFENTTFQRTAQSPDSVPESFWYDNSYEQDTATDDSMSTAGSSTSPSEVQYSMPEFTLNTAIPFYEPSPLSPTSDAPISQVQTCPENNTTSSPKTEIDILMRAIQAKRTTENSSSPSNPTNRSTSAKPKKHYCPLCPKAFTQKTHLDIHLRSHSGEKPYRCREPSCGQSFSQMGNLKTHERRHTGERPFVCEIEGCGKRFAQRGNWRAHLSGVHCIDESSAITGGTEGASFDPSRGKSGRGRFECRLDQCGAEGPCSGKWFTQLGNLKSHQNKFHKETLKVLRERFADHVRAGYSNSDENGGSGGIEMDIGPEERELWNYFEGLYRNCNKGIKGRGKGRRVGVVRSRDDSDTACSAPLTDPTSDFGAEVVDLTFED